MLDVLLERLSQRHRTGRYPREAPLLPDRFRGHPVLDTSACKDGCRSCASACSTAALTVEGGRAKLDLGRCLFCTDCSEACPHGAIAHTGEFRMAARERSALVLTDRQRLARIEPLGAELRRLFGRSLKLRQVSAGGCNACEADVNVLGTVVFDLGRFGIQLVASPRHADGLLVTGPVSENMRLALQKTYEAVPAPKIVIAVGACAIGGGPFAGHPEVAGGAGEVVPVDLYVPGCPPHPYTILDALVRLIGRVKPDRKS